MAVNYNDGKWYGWEGGECPVHPDTVVECLLECGHSGEMPAGWWTVWETEVVAFRVTKEHREPREFWLVSTWGGGFVVNSSGSCGGIHVREVLE